MNRKKLKKKLSKLSRFLLPRRVVDLAIFDDIFPHPQSPFRVAEYNAYLGHFPGARVYSSGEALQALTKTETFKEVLTDYGRLFPQFRPRIEVVPGWKGVKPRLAYCIFLSNTRWALPLAEKAGAGFVFTLYPGAGLQLNERRCDEQLKRVCSSKSFRKVIVTQKVTRDYLAQNGFCPAEQIEFIYGGTFPCHAAGQGAGKKLRFGESKHSFDVCFVAHKYMPQGLDKGYDYFVTAAKTLGRLCPKIRFHVVGPYTPEDFDVSELGERVRFYGSQNPGFFRDFYRRMELIISPNAPFILQPGAFDGFPTGCCMEAGMSGVAVMATDCLGLNIAFRDGDDILIIPREVNEIIHRVEHYYARPEALYAVAERGQASFQRVFDLEAQMQPRLKILESLLRV